VTGGVLDRDACLRLDREDPLRALRERFDLPDGVIYLDGNSLGALPRTVKARVDAVVARQWGRDLINSWNTHGWIGLSAKVGARIARLVGAEPDEVVAADSTSVNLFKLAAAALRIQAPRRVILTEAGDFPTDVYMLRGLAELMGGSVEVRAVPRERIAEALTDEVAVLSLSHAHYKSAAVHDMTALGAQARAVGALTLWDLSHSAGVLDVRLNRDGADLAVGCGYKYLNGGPGAPAFLHVARRHHAGFRSPLPGWLGHARPFAFEDAYDPAPGVLQGVCGTPPVISLSALDEALALFEGVDMAAVQAKALALGDLFIRLVREHRPDLRLASPETGRGGHVSFAHADGYPIMQALIGRGVIGDFREPDILRFGFAPLYLRFADVWDAVEIIDEVMRTENWREPRFQQRAAVT
jgi:kynureninase